MKPIRIDDYCFDRIHLWLQYDACVPQFIEMVVEVFYPANRKANGLVMFDHGFLIGNDLLWYPKKIAGMLLDDNPLFGINPSDYYNYSSALVEKNWAMAFVSASHAQVDWMPWTDIGGNPRVGQEAYAAASYLIKYGMTNFFWLAEAEGHNSKSFDAELASKAKFLISNNVIFAGHSVGGAHAQAAACGFDTLRQIGANQCRPFNPVIYNREFLPAFSMPMASWKVEHRANPVGLLMLSPVDQSVPLFIPGMSDYRAALASRPMPMAMITGQCDCACLDMSQPPAWSDNGTESQFSQLTGGGKGSWVVASQVERGSHCGYLTDKSPLCSVADMPSECKRCPEGTAYKPMGAEAVFTSEMFRKFIGIYPDGGGFQGGFSDWIQSDFITWLNQKSPCCDLNLMQMPGGGYIDNVPPV
jgi:hypothetical protein